VFILAIAGVVTAQVGGAIRRKRLGIVA
jgi:hypothetical protein